MNVERPPRKEVGAVEESSDLWTVLKEAERQWHKSRRIPVILYGLRRAFLPGLLTATVVSVLGVTVLWLDGYPLRPAGPIFVLAGFAFAVLWFTLLHYGD